MKKIFLVFVTFLSLNLCAHSSDLILNSCKVPVDKTLSAYFYEDLYRKDIKPQKVVIAKLSKEFSLSENFVIPSGSFIRGSVVDINNSQNIFKNSQICVNFSEIILPDDKTIVIDTKNVYIKLPIATIMDRSVVTMGKSSLGIATNNQKLNEVAKSALDKDDLYLDEYEVVVEEGTKFNVNVNLIELK